MSFNYDANKTHFHNKGFALSLVLKVKLFGTRKWPNDLLSTVWHWLHIYSSVGKSAAQEFVEVMGSNPVEVT